MRRFQNRLPLALVYSAFTWAGFTFADWSGIRKASYIHPELPFGVAASQAIIPAVVFFIGFVLWPWRISSCDPPVEETREPEREP